MAKLPEKSLTLSDATPFAIRAEHARDAVAREALLDACFGSNRQQRTCQRLRDGRAPAEGLSFSAVSNRRMIGTVRLWHVNAGGVPALVLGPLAVDPSCRGSGIGAALVRHAVTAARARGHGAMILLGDAAYYGRFGFSSRKTAELTLPGQFEREGVLDCAWGMIVPTGKPAPRGKPRATTRAGKLAPQAA
jgi:predicted N-acetyltransferase YhbS